ncbi:MAG: hypothetical protein ACRDLD_02280 [Thermoleophilaceae bacterium]
MTDGPPTWPPADPLAEAEHLGIAKVVKRLGWNKRKLAAEMNRTASAEAFLQRVRKAIEAGDPPRLPHRDSTRGYTDKPWLAMRGELIEAPSKEYVDQLALAAGRCDAQRRAERAADRDRLSLAQRLAILERNEVTFAVDLTRQRASIERRIQAAEAKVDRLRRVA